MSATHNYYERAVPQSDVLEIINKNGFDRQKIDIMTAEYIEKREHLSIRECKNCIDKLLTEYENAADKILNECNVGWESIDDINHLKQHISALSWKLSNEKNIAPEKCAYLLRARLIAAKRISFYGQFGFYFLAKEVDKILERSNFNRDAVNENAVLFSGNYGVPKIVSEKLMENRIIHHEEKKSIKKVKKSITPLISTDVDSISDSDENISDFEDVSSPVSSEETNVDSKKWNILQEHRRTETIVPVRSNVNSETATPLDDADDCYTENGFRFRKTRIHQILKNGAVDVKWQNMPPAGLTAFIKLLARVQFNEMDAGVATEFYFQDGFSFSGKVIHEVLRNGENIVEWHQMTPAAVVACKKILKTLRQTMCSASNEVYIEDGFYFNQGKIHEILKNDLEVEWCDMPLAEIVALEKLLQRLRAERNERTEALDSRTGVPVSVVNPFKRSCDKAE